MHRSSVSTYNRLSFSSILVLEVRHFSTVDHSDSVRKVFTRNGVRLDISSPRLGYNIRLDPLALESLTWQSNDVISKFLETPYGPTEGPPHRPQSPSRRE